MGFSTYRRQRKGHLNDGTKMTVPAFRGKAGRTESNKQFTGLFAPWFCNDLIQPLIERGFQTELAAQKTKKK